ncbi:thiosulfate sulfurtransferase 16, chloroplastic-like isoform X2 [Aristolochia californica]|uniref:thiosulfate sulfurtransferase 16, chloroplastic-like isoform X2 n=1 Tax=Aristolochia californica TaxID=171875 RepID=UPI0035DBE56A
MTSGWEARSTTCHYSLMLGMTKNPNFVEEVASHFGKDDEIIVGCLSGKRSLMAATDLQCAGYTGITDIAGGYSAWVQNGLPTAQ